MDTSLCATTWALLISHSRENDRVDKASPCNKALQKPCELLIPSMNLTSIRVIVGFVMPVLFVLQQGEGGAHLPVA